MLGIFMNGFVQICLRIFNLKELFVQHFSVSLAVMNNVNAFALGACRLTGECNYSNSTKNVNF